MATYHVHCIIKKPYHDDPYTSIGEYGVSTDVMVNQGTERWSQAKMIQVLEDKEHVVRSYGKNSRTGEMEYADLEVHERNSRKYVKSKNDDDKPDSLLELRDCNSNDRR